MAGLRGVKRTLFLTLVTLFAVATFFVVVATANVDGGIFGWNLGPDGQTLIYVTPGGPAARAGIRVNDEIDWRTLPLLGRANLGLVQSTAPGDKLTVTIVRNGQRHRVTLTAVPWGTAVQQSQRAVYFAALFLLAIGIVLVYLRPTRMTWGFLLSFLGTLAGVYQLWTQDALWKFLLGNGGGAMLTGASAAGILIFMSRFPSDHPRGALRVWDRAAIPFGVAAGALALSVVLLTAFSPTPPPAFLILLYEYIIQGLFIVVALGALITAYIVTSGSDRQRIIPVLLTFTLFVGSTMAVTIFNDLITDVAETAIVNGILMFSMVALAIAVAHGIIRHRVIDVSFAVSRTIVYTALTSIVVGVFILIDFVSSKMLDRLQVTLTLEACAALAFGIWLNALHARIDRFVDVVLFRRRHLAEARLERVSRSLGHTESAPFIDEALVVEACDALALASAAVFRRQGDEPYKRVYERGWQPQHVHVLAKDDHLVVNLLAELQPIDLTTVRWSHHEAPSENAQPLLAIPFVVRHDVLGFALYSGHVGGEALDPDEQGVLVRLCDAAASAYEHVNVQNLINEAARLRVQNDLLREMVDPFIPGHLQGESRSPELA